MTYTVINNEKQLHFEIHEGDEVGFLEYRFYKNAIAFMHTEVPSSMEGKGVASALSKYAFEYAKQHHHPVRVYCKFVLTYMNRHPEVTEQLEKNFIIKI